MNLIFDLDGTLINSLPGIAQSLNRSLEQYHLPTHSVEGIREFIGSGSRTLCQRAAGSPDKATIDLLESAFMSHYQELWKSGTEIYSGITDLLDDLSAHHELSILSNKPHAFTTEIIHSLFPSVPFRTILGQRAGISKKPDPSGIHEIISQASDPNTPSYLIGDSVVDLATAKNAAIKSIAVTWGFEPASDLEELSPDHIVHSVAELENLISTL
ncbi:MAG: HAD family hydrolase [Rubritalea sp.]|jgi:phosphoglycolate phosphatase|tara:strand:- start:2115 stop:2756 length:642 start_codon:yes stop_codon:yes gene_type:complete